MEDNSPILAPVVMLILWSLVMLIWLVVVRLPAMSKAGIDLANARGGNSGTLDGMIPQAAQWPAHNYIHLMEQPTLFYAVALVLAVIGQGDGLNLLLAWIYVGLRVAHSIVQATFNRILVRFILFGLSTVALLALAVHAALAVF